MGLQKCILAETKRLTLICYLVPLIVSPKLIDACCKFKNPDFTSGPTVTNISSTKVRVSWMGIVDDLDCADHFYVHYYQTNGDVFEYPYVHQYNPDNNPKGYVEIEVLEDTLYSFRVNALEDGYIWAGCRDNWSEYKRFQILKSGKQF